ncbi:immunoglobulin-like receptor CHIR-AB1 isoform X4 [Gallus gallus]|uniref:immunoglobulin-like receptor CHIR-AB1 isoform X4 n=1 Tax=Gallus gallus TaxID=9031 RepID=UPI001EFF9083|nr:immunoglobulin-like receptor CHIR-AB1 isoform X4 [Gallus gallus]
MRLPLRPLPFPTAVSLSPGCSCLMAPMAVALILGWWLVAASRAQQLPQPSLSLHPSQGVSLGDTVTLRCHLPRMAAWVQLWLNGTLRFDKEKDKEQDAAEFSFAVTNLEDAGTYQCRYQVSEPLWTSNQSDPVELVLTGAKEWSHGNLLVAVLRGCAAVLVFSLGLYFVLDARSLWTRRDESAGVTPEMPESKQFQDVTLMGRCCQIPSVWKGAEVTSQLSPRKKFLTQAAKRLPSIAEIFDDTGCRSSL